MSIDTCMKFPEDSLNSFQDIERTLFVQELRFLHSARRLMLIYIHMKFCEDSWNSFQVIERT